MSDKTISAAEKIERGRRLKQARLLTGMTITDLTQDRFINYNTFCAWESGRHAGLTLKGAKKAIKRLGEYGVECSLDWLMSGMGYPPKRVTDLAQANTQPPHRSLTTEALEVLKLKFPGFVVCPIEDDAMLPIYHKGDYLLGPQANKGELKRFDGQPVIATLTSGETIVRMVQVLPDHKDIKLVSNNPLSLSPKIWDSSIEKLAVVLVHLKYVSPYDKATPGETH